MAIQDFVGGSFRGKMGALVGQRWKDINIIRTYSKPRNPKTPAQIAVRKRFAQCVEICQQANQMDFRAIPFQSEENTVWSLRMKTAQANWKFGEPPIMYIPLVQVGQTAGIVIAPMFSVGIENVTVTFDSKKDVAGRSLSILLFVPVESKIKGDYYLLEAVIAKTASGYSFSFQLPRDVGSLSGAVICATSYNEMSISEKILMKPAYILAQE